jgi:hypothetical protein
VEEEQGEAEKRNRTKRRKKRGSGRRGGRILCAGERMSVRGGIEEGIGPRRRIGHGVSVCERSRKGVSLHGAHINPKHPHRCKTPWPSS